MMATMLKRVEEQDVVREAEARVERRERQAERNIEKLPAMAEGADLELYIQSFENDLAQAGICREKWKSYLTPRLPPSLKDHIGDLQADHTTTYDQIKDRLAYKSRSN